MAPFFTWAACATCAAVLPWEFVWSGWAPSLMSMSTIFALPASAATCRGYVVFSMTFFDEVTLEKPCSFRKVMTAVLRSMRSRSSNIFLPSSSLASTVRSSSSRSRLTCSNSACSSFRAPLSCLTFSARSWLCRFASSSWRLRLWASSVRRCSSWCCLRSFSLKRRSSVVMCLMMASLASPEATTSSLHPSPHRQSERQANMAPRPARPPGPTPTGN
mmetsp:Transcript_473/g.1556  ORF Transcript_473/g.1556 Transcript_473/m.1556 type:complete len:217 (-) Transcript_473:20-670(-)